MTRPSTESASGAADGTPLDDRLGAILADIPIPPCPAILSRLQAQMQLDEPDLPMLARLISSDVALSAGLIALCNSPFFGLRERVRTVEAALMMLGLTQASRAIAGLVLRQAFPPSPAMERFWDASGSVARLSGWLCQYHRLEVRPDEAYTFGLFRDAGIAVLWQRFTHYPAVLQRANSEATRSFTQVEDEVLPTNHAVVGAVLAQGWWLSDATCCAIRQHHDYPSVVGSAEAREPQRSAGALVALAQLAEHLLQQHTGLSHTCEWDKAAPSVLARLRIGEDDVRALYAQAVAAIGPAG